MFIHSSSMMDISYPAWTLLFVLFGLVLVEPHNGGISVNDVHAFFVCVHARTLKLIYIRRKPKCHK